MLADCQARHLIIRSNFPSATVNKETREPDPGQDWLELMVKDHRWVPEPDDPPRQTNLCWAA